MPCGRIEAFLADLRAGNISVNPAEIERRVGICRRCCSHEGCDRISPEQWLELLVRGGLPEAAELCQEWKP